jgi:hypothetical protein
MTFLRSVVVWLVFILAESLNGTIRIVWLMPGLGEAQAERISFITGSILVMAIATCFIRWLQATQTAQLLYIGLLWMALTLAFEIALGRFILGYSWLKIAANFNLLNGKLMPIGLGVLTLAPLIAVRIRNTFTSWNPELTIDRSL